MYYISISLFVQTLKVPCLQYEVGVDSAYITRLAHASTRFNFA